MRLDVYLAAKEMTKSRQAAKNLIEEGGVSVNGVTVKKPSAEVTDSDSIEITAQLHGYVGRGGLKLEKALEVFGINPEGMVCADMGASTGGFTDCLLKNGAAYVYAVDVGHGQLAPSLAADSRVCNMEGVNVRDVSPKDFDRQIQFVTADVSFISLTKIIPAVSSLLERGGMAVMLIKPQFECGRADIGKKGIVRSPKVHERVLSEITDFLKGCSMGVCGLDHSPVCGGDGNIEYLVFARKDMPSDVYSCRDTVKNAHEGLRR
ncbi:MAG: TlyA family RNA methyltransferase [Oscillospiraceae bacterium]|nr:TlyA family RNA methyltransferase [Oscillospiraceae bacterium]